MKPSAALARNRQAVIGLVHKHRASNARVFGSVLSGTDREDSDLDLLIDPSSEMSLFDLGALRADLHSLLGVRVDVLTPDALPERVRTDVLTHARPV